MAPDIATGYVTIYKSVNGTHHASITQRECCTICLAAHHLQELTDTVKSTHYAQQCAITTTQITLLTLSHIAVCTQVTQLHAHHQHAEQCSNHHTVWFWLYFQPDTSADIRSSPALIQFDKFKSGTSLIVEVCVCGIW